MNVFKPSRAYAIHLRAAFSLILITLAPLLGCQSDPGAADIHDAIRLDHQTRYLGIERPGGIQLTVFIASRGRPLDRSAVIRLEDALNRATIAMATSLEETPTPRDPAKTHYVVETHPGTGESFWRAESQVRWRRP